jgi:hypothetical protein
LSAAKVGAEVKATAETIAAKLVPTLKSVLDLIIYFLHNDYQQKLEVVL